MEKLKFRLVFERKINMYHLQFNDKYNIWHRMSGEPILTKTGKQRDNTSEPGFGLISEKLLWDMEYLRDLGYEFIGIVEEEKI